ncbi:uncharacterized protein ZK1073.1-like isoform X2 [Gigantopelta aegis]|uniref:uncharacterized protein ZK1073.1-like isoform X2 n=1 Tax=Gigantopelta aegis TaxID=1735272 RepID=UPI001B88C6C9|nr:uncharacterized protein ZK1073.1-like isoform X2 [Gigantopelta aegis]
MGLEVREISAPRVGRFKVYIQGDLKHKQFVVLTVHDLGCNHSMWTNFLSHYSMEEITKRAAFIHVDVPGQEDEAPDLPADYTFPTMQSLGEDLVCVLDQLDVKQVVGLGEGAGANIILRFALAQPGRVLGACLIHCTGQQANFMESMKEKMNTWKLDQIGMNPTAEAYLVVHRFGTVSKPSAVRKVILLDQKFAFEKAQNKDQLDIVIEGFQQSLRSKINPKNLKRFVHAYLTRSNVMDVIGKLRCQVLMVTGTKASFNKSVHALFDTMRKNIDKKLVDFLEVDGVANVLEEKPDRFAETFLFFLQGLGLVGGVPMPRVQRSASIGECGTPPGRTRSMSMEEADQPTRIYSKSPPKYSTSPVAISTSAPMEDSPVASSPPKS